MPVLKLPKDIEELRVRLEKTKDREARLEADLAIREQPEVEDGIIRLILKMIEMKKTSAAYKAVGKPESGKQKQVEALRNQVQFYKNKIDAINDQLKDLEGKDSKPHGKLYDNRLAAQDELNQEFETQRDVFEIHKIDILQLVPTLRDYIGKAGMT